ncbi:cadherin-4 [Ditylenchus destructor]|uniref:Cadherin-4 n=1 Tax=Ditylenchus destructor TaxID=166010 RepID=A0AAD4MX87_9BILA|nr:cadherin-4 [Ditylenchus destructor]
MGIVGCFGRISIDGFDLSKTEQGLRMHNVAVGCDTSAMGPCLSVPCLNGGQCLPNRTHNSYTCTCPSRYTGSNCEIDLNACASNPCPPGITCHNLYNDFHCSCPSGFTGKTCQLRGELDPCLTSPCGPYGVCVRQTNDFTCNCTHGFYGNFCTERMPKIEPDSHLLLNSFEFYVLLAVLLLAIFLSSLAIYMCHRQHSSPTSGSTRRKRSKVAGAKPTPGDDPNVCNPLVPRATVAPGQGTADRPPPPLPPKFLRNAQLYQNLGGGHHNSTSRLPTVEVRPMRCYTRGGSPSVKSSNNDITGGPPELPAKKNSSGSRRNITCARRESEGGSIHNLCQPEATTRQYGSAASDLERVAVQNNTDMLRMFGRRINNSPGSTHNHHSRHQSHEQFFEPVLLDPATRGISDSIQCLSTEAEVPAHYSQQIQTACAAAALNIRLEKEKLDNLTRNVLADFDAENNSDYLTMKPIHRAKPFRNGDVNLQEISSNFDDNSVRPPTPPLHRRPLENRSASTKLYDNPNDNTEDDTLSNVTSNALDEIIEDSANDRP